MQCPRCGSPEVYRSKRALFERVFNSLFWYHQRPYRCALCMTRYWVRLEPRVWRHTLRMRVHKALRAWGLYIGALLLTAIIAWTMNFIQKKSQEGNPLIDAAVNQEMLKQLDKTDLTDEQKEQAEDFFKTGK